MEQESSKLIPEVIKNSVIIIALDNYANCLKIAKQYATSQEDIDFNNAMEILVSRLIQEFPIEYQKPQWEQLKDYLPK